MDFSSNVSRFLKCYDESHDILVTERRILITTGLIHTVSENIFSVSPCYFLQTIKVVIQNYVSGLPSPENMVKILYYFFTMSVQGVTSTKIPNLKEKFQTYKSSLSDYKNDFIPFSETISVQYKYFKNYCIVKSPNENME